MAVTRQIAWSAGAEPSLANAVARVENLEFLTDVVPKTQTFKQYKAKQAKEAPAAKETADPLPNGQKTLDNHVAAEGEQEVAEPQATNGASHDAMDLDEEKVVEAPVE